MRQTGLEFWTTASEQGTTILTENPDGPPPVAVAAKHPAVGLPRGVPHREVLLSHLQAVGLRFVLLGQLDTRRWIGLLVKRACVMTRSQYVGVLRHAVNHYIRAI